MGHDIHFLRRVERLSPAQADLALTLYREPALVAHVLERTDLPDGADRVALALEDAPTTPYVIVARNGHFVTCLAEGMSPTGCPVVLRSQVDHASERIAALRATLAGGQSETRRLYRRLIERGSGLSREDFTALAALMPIMAEEYLEMAMELCRYQVRFHDRYQRGRYRKITPETRDELHKYWTATWALGHLTAICGERADDLQALSRRSKVLFESSVHALLAGTMFSMCTPVVMRGVWTTARAGRMLLPWARQRLQTIKTMSDALLAAMPLTVIGLRHRRAQGEVCKALARCRRGFENASPDDPMNETFKELLVLFEQAMDPAEHERMRTIHRNTGARAAVRYTDYLPEGAPLRFTRAEDVPDELALPMLMHLHSDLLQSGPFLVLVVVMLPWLATASGPAMYLPAQLLDQSRSLFDAEKLGQQVENRYGSRQREQPARAPERPGRNQPCTCGSGQKYKRCCGADA